MKEKKTDVQPIYIDFTFIECIVARKIELNEVINLHATIKLGKVL